MGNAVELRKIQNRIFKRTNQFGGHLFHDDDWSNVSKMVGIIKDTEGVNDIDVWAGEYHNYINKAKPIDPAYRDYKIVVYTDFGKLGGYIRCCAAGTVEDEFSSYDMIVSVYPVRDEMLEGKKIVITRKQLNEIMDSNMTDVSFKGSNAAEMGTNAAEAYKDATASGIKPNSIKLNGKSNNNVVGNNTTITFDSSNGNNIQTAVSDAVEDATANGADLSKLNIVGTPGALAERKYTKKQVEEARLYEMRKNGECLTKKQLRESVVNSAPQFYQLDLTEGTIDMTEPVYQLTEGDIDEENSEVMVNGKAAFVITEYCNFDGFPMAGDYVFESFGEYGFYRIDGEFGVTGFDSIVIGTREDIFSWVGEYSEELVSDYELNPEDILKQLN